MSSPLKFLFELVDKTSAPAKGITRQLTDVEKAMQRLDRQAKRLRDSIASATRTPAQNRALRQFDRIASLRETMAEMERLRGANQVTSQSFRELASGASGWIAVATTVAAVTAGAAIAVAHLGLEFGRTAVEATAFQESTMTQLQTLLGSEGAATHGFSFAQTVARQTPLDSPQVFGAMQEATAGGFRGQWLDDMVAASADVGSLNPTDQGASQRFILQMGQMWNSARLQMMDLRPAAQAARLAPNEVKDRAARYAGLSRRDGEGDLAWQRRRDQAEHSGRITGQMGVRGLMDAMVARNGGRQLGALAQVQSTTLTGVLSNLRSTVFDLLQSLNLSRIPGMVAFRRFLLAIAGVLSPASAQGKRLANVLSNVIDLLFGTLFGGDATNQVVPTFERMLDLMEATIGAGRYLSPLLRALFGGVFEGAGAVLGPLVVMFGMLFGGKTQKGAASIATALLWVGRIIGFVLTLVAIAVTAVLGTFALVAGALVSLFALPIAALLAIGAGIFWVLKALTELAKNVGVAGFNIAVGLANGIRSGIGAVGDAASELANSVFNRVRAKFRIASPSRAMFELGLFVDEGFARGMESGRSGRAMGDMVEPQGGRRLGAMAGGGIQLTVIVQRGDGDPEDLGERVARSAAELLTDWMETTALQGA